MKFLVIILVIVLAFALLTGCSGSKGGDSDAGYRRISMAEATEEMESAEDFILLDVRRPDEFAAGHIPGAINVANESIGSEKPAELPDTDQQIYVYCRSGNRSQQASAKLVKLGYTNIVEIGGINSWEGEIVTE